MGDELLLTERFFPTIAKINHGFLSDTNSLPLSLWEEGLETFVLLNLKLINPQ